MFGKRKQARQAAVGLMWKQLKPDDPFVQAYAEPGEVVWDGVNAIDWTKRQEPGNRREDCECLLVLTSRRLFMLGANGSLEFDHEDMLSAQVRTKGAQGIMTLRMEVPQGTFEREFSMHAAIAPVLVKRLNEYLA